MSLSNGLDFLTRALLTDLDALKVCISDKGHCRFLHLAATATVVPVRLALAVKLLLSGVEVSCVRQVENTSAAGHRSSTCTE